VGRDEREKADRGAQNGRKSARRGPLVGKLNDIADTLATAAATARTAATDSVNAELNLLQPARGEPIEEDHVMTTERAPRVD
jgi:hypothetical protein